MPAPTLVMQTTYAELLQRCASATFSDTFPQDGVFIPKTINNRKYWYFQSSSKEGRSQKYVGPETTELLLQIEHHKDARDDERERRALVSTLVRSFGLPRPIPEIGNILAALSKAGVFRLRAVLIGTVAYQTYAAMLGTRLPISILQTSDIDIAQFRNVSVAIDDQTPPVLEVLKKADKTFRAVGIIHKGRVTSYASKTGVRVDFLTPNEGRDTDKPQRLPALQTDAEPVRFLDFLIHESEPAVLLNNAGIYVNVPTPQRYAIHKLIVSRRRREGTAKRDKDIQQAAALLDILIQKRPHELRSAWEEAFSRGNEWRRLVLEGMTNLAANIRDGVLKVIGQKPDLIPGNDLTFENAAPIYDFSRDLVTFAGKSMGHPIQSAISRAALDDHFGTDGLGQKGRIEAFLKNRSTIESLARTKYLSYRVEEPGSILVGTTDVPELMKKIAALKKKSGTR